MISERHSALVQTMRDWTVLPAVQWAILAVATAVCLTIGAIYFQDPPAAARPRSIGRALDSEVPLSPTEILRTATAPIEYKPLAPADALEENARIPIAPGDVPIATPYIARRDDAESYARASDCLTAAIYYEAGNESERGKLAVAQVVLNRLRHPAFPKTVCDVVFQGSERTAGCQFTFTCDGAMARLPEQWRWQAARQVADGALSGRVEPTVGWATNYHANYVLPYWAMKLAKTVVIGTHIFYRLPGSVGLPRAFSGQPLPVEPLFAPLRQRAIDRELAAAEAAASKITPVLDFPTGAEPIIVLPEPTNGTAVASAPTDTDAARGSEQEDKKPDPQPSPVARRRRGPLPM